MQTNKNYFFVVARFDGKDTKYKRYNTLRGVEKRIGTTINNPYRQINYGSNVLFEGNKGTDKIAVFREFKG